MLSIIICSIHPHQLKRVSINIEKTVGIPFEIIAIDNRQQPRGITAVYNEGARKAKFEHVCFVHEDVMFVTESWGQLLINHFEDEKLGLIGVAGSAHKSRTPSGWGPSGLDSRFIKINMIQHFKNEKTPPVLQHFNSSNEKIAEVVCLDGLFLASTKEIILENPFDEDRLTGFHCYDLDISFAIGEKYKVAVIYDIEIHHFSEGTLGRDWIINTLILHEKWANKLPKTIGEIPHKELIHCEKESFRFLVRLCRKYVTVDKAIKVLQKGNIKKLSYITYLKMYFSIFRMYYLKKD